MMRRAPDFRKPPMTGAGAFAPKSKGKTSIVDRLEEAEP
jgi:hypothetical protein